MTTAMDVVEALLGADLRAVQRELQQLTAIRDWAIRQTNFAVGDKVVISADLLCPDGWKHYAEALRGGVGTIQKLDFSAMHDAWFAEVKLDREWSTVTAGGQVARYWHGPAAETPEGMQPPSPYDERHHPDGRKHVFMLRLRWLRHA